MQKYRFYGNNFYALALRSSYEASGVWPADGVDIDEPVFAEFSGKSPAGMVRGTGNDGFPCWVATQPRSHDELIMDAEEKRQELLRHADTVTADWRTELSLGEISDDDRASLSAWMAYKREVKSVAAEDALTPGFEWPVKPE